MCNFAPIFIGNPSSHPQRRVGAHFQKAVVITKRPVLVKGWHSTQGICITFGTEPKQKQSYYGTNEFWWRD